MRAVDTRVMKGLNMGWHGHRRLIIIMRLDQMTLIGGRGLLGMVFEDFLLIEALGCGEQYNYNEFRLTITVTGTSS